MSNYQRKTSIKEDCNIERSLNMISGKWKPAILSGLLKSTLRLKDMQEGLPDASKRALTQQLKELIEDGLIKKKDFEEYPKRTEYSLTSKGENLKPVFEALSQFGENN